MFAGKFDRMRRKPGATVVSLFNSNTKSKPARNRVTNAGVVAAGG